MHRFAPVRFGARGTVVALAALATLGATEPIPLPPPPPGTVTRRSRPNDHGELAAYIRAMEDPSRAAWQKPDRVVAALELAPGAEVCDIGAGPGYFSLPIARVVGPSGHVWAVDVEPEIIAALRDRIETSGLANVTPVLAPPDDPFLPAGRCDLVLVVDTYHHFPNGRAYLAKIRRLLAPGGRLAEIDFKAGDLPIGPPDSMKIPRERFLDDAAAAGFELAAEHDFLPYQYFVVLRPKEPKTDE